MPNSSSFPLRQRWLVAVGLLVVTAGAVAAAGVDGSVPPSVESHDRSDTVGHSTDPVGGIENAEETLTVTNATVDRETVHPNESVEVTAAVENPTADHIAAKIELTVDGTVETTLIETVEAGETNAVGFGLTLAEPRSYRVSVAGTPAGTVAVREETQDETPGFGIAAVVAALLALLIGRLLTNKRID